MAIEEIDGGLLRTRGNAIDLAFRMQGEGRTVVLLHGTSANHAVWEPVAAAIAGAARVVSVDQRGHGRSAKPAAGYTGPDFAADVVGLLDALEVSRAVVVGHSLGARNAWLFGALHPDRTDALVCVDYTPWVRTTALHALRARVARGDRTFADAEEVRRYLTDRYPRLPADAVARRARWGYGQQDDGSWRALADPGAMSLLVEGLDTPWDAEFRSVQAPMAHLRGSESQFVDGHAWECARTARPADRWVTVDDADHYVAEEHPALVATEIAAVLDRH